jgi:hypothetical protein
MASTDTGTPLNGSAYIIEVKDKITSDRVRRSLDRSIVAAYPAYLSFLPVDGARPDGLPQMPLLAYQGCTVTQDKVGDRAMYALRYEQTVPDPGETPPPPVIRRRAGQNERDMREHPDFDGNLDLFWDEFSERLMSGSGVPEELAGRRHWWDISSEVSVTTYYSSDPGSLLESSLGALENPPGEAGDNKWKVIDGSNGRDGRWWSETFVYQYRGTGWDATADKQQ